MALTVSEAMLAGSEGEDPGEENWCGLRFTEPGTQRSNEGTSGGWATFAVAMFALLRILGYDLRVCENSKHRRALAI
jgi:hypothetical protein